jgi:hypothetical protein
MAGTPDALGLAAALAERGIECVVEARDRLAVLFTGDEWPALEDAAERRALHQLATTYGFTHVALELDALDASEGDAGGRVVGDIGGAHPPRARS